MSDTAKQEPTTSPSLITAVSTGVLGVLLRLVGTHPVAILLGLVALVTAIVGLARKEPLRGLAPLSILCAVICIV